LANVLGEVATVITDLFVNVTERKLVRSATDPATFQLAERAFVAGDKVIFRVMFLLRTSFAYGVTQFSQINPSGLAIKLGVGQEGGNTFSETTSFSISGNQIIGTLDLTTAEFVAAANAGTATVFYIKTSEGGGDYQTVFETPITPRKSISSVTTTPAAGATYLTRDECLALFVKYIGDAGKSVTLTSPDGTKGTVLYTDDAGAFHSDPAT
jgi:hypothetical protein